MNSESNRPPGHYGKREHYLTSVAKDLERVITRAYGSLANNIPRLSKWQARRNSQVLVEFAEDIHNDIGIWNSLEHYNVQFFGTPLPIYSQSQWNGYPEGHKRTPHSAFIMGTIFRFTPELTTLSNTCGFKGIGEEVADFLNKRFKDIPRGSSVKTFLNES